MSALSPISFEADEHQLVRVIASYLKEKGCYESLSSLLVETNVSLHENSNKESIFLQRLVLQGRWDDLLRYIKPILDGGGPANVHLSNQVSFIVLKQKLLETLSWQGGGGERWVFPPWRPSSTQYDDRVELEDIIDQINTLKPFCTVQQFNSICLFLTIERLDDHPEFGSWSVAEGRWKSFLQLQLLLSQVCGIFSYKRENKQDDAQLLQKYLSLGLLSYLNQDVAAATPSENIVQLSHGRSKINCLKTAIREMSDRGDVVSSIPQVQFHPTVTVLKKFLGPEKPVEISAEDNNRKAAFDGSMEMGATVPWPKAQREQQEDDDRKEEGYSRPKSSVASEKPKVPVSWTVEVVENNVPAAESQAHKQPPANLIKRLSAGGGQMSEVNQSMEKRSSTPSSIRKQDSVRNSYSKHWAEDKDQPQHSHNPQQEAKHHAAVEAQHTPAQRNPTNAQAKPTQISSRPVTSDPLRVEEAKARPTSASRPQSAGRSSPDKVSSRPSTQQQHTTLSASLYNKHLIFHTNVPLRCAMELVTPHQSGNHHDLTHLAIGSNAKNIQVIKFKKSDLHASHKHHVESELYDSKDDVTLQHQLENVHKGSVYAMDWHGSSQLLASGSNDKSVRISKPLEGAVGATLKGHSGTVRVLKYNPFSEDQVILASAGAGDFKPRLWDVNTGSCQRVMAEHPATIHGMAWLDQNIFVTGCESGVIIAHDIRSEAPAWVIELPKLLETFHSNTQSMFRSICCLSTLPNSMQLTGKHVVAVGSVQGSATILHGGKVLFDQPLHKEDIRSIVLARSNFMRSDDGFPAFELLSSSYDSTASLWTMYNQRGQLQCQRDYQLSAGHKDKVLSANHLHQSRDIVTTGADGRVVFWAASSL